MLQTSPSFAQQLRGEIFARNIPLYIIAARIGLHPGTLGQMLLGRIPLPGGVAERIDQVLREAQNA